MDKDTGISISGKAFRNESVGKIELRNTPIAIIIDGPTIGISANNRFHLSFLFFMMRCPSQHSINQTALRLV